MSSSTPSPKTATPTESASPTETDSTSESSSSSTPTGATSETPTDPEQNTTPDPDGEDDNPSREAAKYRRRLRETETERDQLADEITELRGKLERFHSGKLTEAVGGRVNLAALRGLDADLTGIVRDDGTVNAERARALLTEHEISPKTGGYIPQSGTGNQGPTGDGVSWADAIQERNK